MHSPICDKYPVVQEARITLLQQMPIFGGVSTGTLNFILAISPTVSLPKGAFFFHENETADAIYVLEQGKAAVLKLWQDEQYVVRHLAAGDCFGEMALMDLFPRSASVAAEEDSRALRIFAGLSIDSMKRSTNSSRLST